MSVDQSEILRLFVAVSLPEEILVWLRGFQKRLITGATFTGAQLNWINPENAHITMAFLGEQNRSELQTVKDICRSAANQSAVISLAMGRLVLFPTPQAPKVISLDIGGDVESLANLQREIALRLQDGGFDIDDREFRPHITLARMPSTRGLPGLRGLVASHTKMVYRPFTCSGIHLVQSILKPSGPEYVYLEEFPLAGEATQLSEPETGF